KKAIVACEGSGQEKDDHFRDATKMVEIGSSTVRQVRDWKLDRYACYLIAQNGDSKKQEIALAQTYFAIQTRKQEEFDQLLEDKKRLDLRGEIKKHNVSLAEAAGNAGVVNYGKFQNFGYKGLYGGLDANDIHKKKKLKKTQKILDHMGSEELAANLFRATQADAKLRRDKIKGEERANVTHFAVGQKVRKTIEDLGGTMPEELPSTDGICNSKKRIGNDEKKNKILEK
ncbi:MAG: DNA-damage-inducible protein D, partial [Candidatus Berkelbacteria bacterium Athens1014_28]